MISYFSLQFHQNRRKRDQTKVFYFFHIRFLNVQLFSLYTFLVLSECFLCEFASDVHWRISYTVRSRKSDSECLMMPESANSIGLQRKSFHLISFFTLRKSRNSIFVLSHSWMFCMKHSEEIINSIDFASGKEEKFLDRLRNSITRCKVSKCHENEWVLRKKHF